VSAQQRSLLVSYICGLEYLIEPFFQECPVPYSIKSIGKIYDIKVSSEKMSYCVNDAAVVEPAGL